jgi:hypothetical protein
MVYDDDSTCVLEEGSCGGDVIRGGGVHEGLISRSDTSGSSQLTDSLRTCLRDASPAQTPKPFHHRPESRNSHFITQSHMSIHRPPNKIKFIPPVVELIHLNPTPREPQCGCRDGRKRFDSRVHEDFEVLSGGRDRLPQHLEL